MPNKRHARRTHRDAARRAAAGDHRAARAAYLAATAEYRDYLAGRDDEAARAELADALAGLARAHTALGAHAEAADAWAGALELLRELGAPRSHLASAGLDLAESLLACDRLLSAAVAADEAVRAFDRRDAADPAGPGFAELAEALARNARILYRAADPDLAVGAADQSARMLLALPTLEEDPRRVALLRSVLALAWGLHRAAGREAYAQAAARRFARQFPGQEPPGLEAARPLTLREALTTAGRLRVFGDPNLVDRLCPDPVAHTAPPAISARCDPGLAAVALHATGGAVEALRRSHAPVAWRLGTEIHYLLAAADRQGERNLRLNFRDHGPVWLSMLVSLTEAAARRPGLAADLAVVLAELAERLRSRHAWDGHGPAAVAAERFIAAYRR